MTYYMWLLMQLECAYDGNRFNVNKYTIEFTEKYYLIVHRYKRGFISMTKKIEDMVW